MQNYKLFLINVCNIDNITIQELMEITGKSKSVVYSWLNLSKPDFPTIDSLGKILFRMGISLEDFINYRHPVYDNGKFARTYGDYISGYWDESYIQSDILELPNADEVISTYLHDRSALNNMIQDYVNGLEIDMERFELLCKELRPMFASDDSVISEAGVCIDNLNRDTLKSYKYGLEILKEAKEDNEGDPNYEPPEHYMFYPDANYVILLAAEKNPSFINEYLTIIDDIDKRFLLEDYMRICEENPDYDKKNRIIKRLVESDCTFLESKDKDIKEKYCELMKRILMVR